MRGIFRILAAIKAHTLSIPHNRKLTALKNFRFLLFLLSTLVVFTNCKKECKLKSPSKEEGQILAFAQGKGYAVEKHSSGLYYQIVDPGTGAQATASSNITITYKGTFLNDSVFDEGATPNTPAWPLSGLIEGWKIGIPLIREGGRIRLIVPSSQAYGCEDYYTIPGNSVLFFDITLIGVN